MQSQVLRSNAKLEDCVRISDNITSVLPTLTSSLEEADARVVPYFIHAIDNDYKHEVIVSIDTDVVGLMLYFLKAFSLSDLLELWFLYGTGGDSKHIVIQLIVLILGPKQFSEIMKVIERQENIW